MQHKINETTWQTSLQQIHVHAYTITSWYILARFYLGGRGGEEGKCPPYQSLSSLKNELNFFTEYSIETQHEKDVAVFLIAVLLLLLINVSVHSLQVQYPKYPTSNKSEYPLLWSQKCYAWKLVWILIYTLRNVKWWPVLRFFSQLLTRIACT